MSGSCMRFIFFAYGAGVNSFFSLSRAGSECTIILVDYFFGKVVSASQPLSSIGRIMQESYLYHRTDQLAMEGW